MMRENKHSQACVLFKRLRIRHKICADAKIFFDVSAYSPIQFEFRLLYITNVIELFYF